MVSINGSSQRNLVEIGLPAIRRVPILLLCADHEVDSSGGSHTSIGVLKSQLKAVHAHDCRCE